MKQPLSINKALQAILLVCFLPALQAQQMAVPETEFIPPLDIPLYLTGTFGELRSGHFHSGIDIKTQAEIGKPLYAVQDGYVSRIKITENGYGKALYIAHTNGYTSVYAHMNRFSEPLEAYTRSKQYENQSFEVNLFPSPSRFEIKKGDLIGYSGNSGGSLGPHLHFELRVTNSEEPVNPLHFYKNFKDNIRPTVYKVALYPATENSLINGSHRKVIFTPKKEYNHFTIEEPVKVHGKFGIGVETYDYMNGTRNRYGIYSIRLYVDSALHFHQVMNKFSFYETRYINSLIDYEENVKTHAKIQKLFIEPNNKLSTYQVANNDGYLHFQDNKVHHVTISIRDIFDNESTINLSFVAGDPDQIPEPSGEREFSKRMYYNQPNQFSYPGIQVSFPENSFYDTLLFTYTNENGGPDHHSRIHYVHNPYTPVHEAYELNIVPDELSDSLLEKAGIVLLPEEDTPEFLESEIQNGFIRAYPRELGRFVVMLDTLAPDIRPLNITDGKNMEHEQRIALEVSDDFSGVKSYSGLIDGEWVLFEYDKKNDLFFYTFDEERLPMNRQHKLVFTAGDYSDNVGRLELSFFK